jgi:hypothetical protein
MKNRGNLTIRHRETKPKTEEWSYTCSETFNSNMYSIDPLPFCPHSPLRSISNMEENVQTFFTRSEPLMLPLPLYMNIEKSIPPAGPRPGFPPNPPGGGGTPDQKPGP